MTIRVYSERYKYQCANAVKNAWLVNTDKPLKSVSALYDKYMLNEFIPNEVKERFHKILVDFMSAYLINRYTTLIETSLITIKQVERIIVRQPLKDVYDILFTMIDIWNIRYNGPSFTLKEINTHQSVHATVVVKNTNNGVDLLLNMVVPEDQRTLLEIEKAWAMKNNLERANILRDMQEWGRRRLVMSKNDNIYRKVLRGLWAKIKLVNDIEIRNQLIQRLWEECKESYEMCADGHVARLINVLVGFDNDFGNNISQMEYFQNNISLIAASDAPINFKIEQAKRLMNDINMPDNERSVWIEAL
jgi:hypothetical protein